MNYPMRKPSICNQDLRLIHLIMLSSGDFRRRRIQLKAWPCIITAHCRKKYWWIAGFTYSCFQSICRVFRLKKLFYFLNPHIYPGVDR